MGGARRLLRGGGRPPRQQAPLRLNKCKTLTVVVGQLSCTVDPQVVHPY